MTLNVRLAKIYNACLATSSTDNAANPLKNDLEIEEDPDSNCST